MPYLLALLCLLCACRSQPSVTPGKTDVYTFAGEVLKFDPVKSTATIKHGPMLDSAGKVWMEAMTMDFPIREARDAGLLKPGVKIKAKYFQRPADFDYWVGQVELIP